MNKGSSRIMVKLARKCSDIMVGTMLKTKNLLNSEQISVSSGSDGHRPILKKRIPDIAGSKISTTYSV